MVLKILIFIDPDRDSCTNMQILFIDADAAQGRLREFYSSYKEKEFSLLQ